nr:hypothetical protein CFP56_56025 [Quercus suber]
MPFGEQGRFGLAIPKDDRIGLAVEDIAKAAEGRRGGVETSVSKAITCRPREERETRQILPHRGETERSAKSRVDSLHSNDLPQQQAFRTSDDHAPSTVFETDPSRRLQLDTAESNMSRLLAVELPRRTQRETRVTNDESESDPDRLLDHQYRTKRIINKDDAIRTSLPTDESNGEDVSDENEQGHMEEDSDLEAERSKREAISHGQRRVGRQARETISPRVDGGDLLRHSHNLESESSNEIKPLVHQHRAEIARRVSTGKLKPVRKPSLKTIPVSGRRPLSMQRKLGPEMSARPDIFGIEESPQKPRGSRLDQASAFSPMRKQRKTHAELEQEQLDDQLGVGNDKVPGVQVPRISHKRPRDHDVADFSTNHDFISGAIANDREDRSENEQQGPLAKRGRSQPRRLQQDTEVRRTPTKDIEQHNVAGAHRSASRRGGADESQISTNAQMSLTLKQADESNGTVDRSQGKISRAQVDRINPSSLIFIDEIADSDDHPQPGSYSVGDGADDVEDRSNAKRQAMVRAKMNKQAEKQQAAENENVDDHQEENCSQDESHSNAESHSGSENDTNESDRVLGQWPALRKIFRARKFQANAVKHEGIALKDKLVKAIVNKCESAGEKILASNETGDGLAQDLVGIGNDVRALYTRTNGNEPELDNVRRGKAIYAHLFPKLIEVLERMVGCFETMDVRGHARGRMSYSHLERIIALVDVILGLYGDQNGGAKQYHVRPKSAIPLIKPAESMCVSLKGVRKAFAAALNQHRQEKSRQEQKLRQSQANAAAREREEAERLASEAYLLRREKWAQLHSVRNRVEDRYLPDAASYIRHIAFPEIEFEEDSDGYPMDRLEIFVPRVGPPLAMVEEARNRVWTEEESNALQTVLEVDHGPMVFEKLIKKYCGVSNKKRQILNKYNVTEIVTRAADMKQEYIRLQSQNGGIVEDWVKEIPEWVKPAPLPGQENDDRNAELEAVPNNDNEGGIDIYIDPRTHG